MSTSISSHSSSHSSNSDSLGHHGGLAVVGGIPTGIPANPFEEIASQLKRMTLSVKRNTNAFAIQSQDVAAHKEDVHNHTQALGDLRLNLMNLESTAKFELHALGSSFDDGYDRLVQVIEKNSKAQALEHQLLMDTLQSYMRPK